MLLAGLALNIALMGYIYFLVDGGPAAVKQGDWMAILNEIPMTLVFFLAGVFKPYLMVWSKCRKNPDVIMAAGRVMLVSTAIACWASYSFESNVAKDMALYINWAMLWAASAYYVLLPQPTD